MRRIFYILSLFSLLACQDTDFKNIEIRKLFSPFVRDEDPLDSLAERAHDIESDTSVQELKKDIKRQTKFLNSVLVASQKLGRNYYLLGLKFIDYQMYSEALKYLQMAMEYYPENPELFYNAGVCYGWLAEAQTDPRKKKEYLNQARFNLERALKLMPNHAHSLLALAVLYSYNFDMAYQAKELIKRYNVIESPTVTSQFVEAHIAVQTMDEARAIELYSDLALTAPTTKEREKAAFNRDALLGR